MLAPEDEKDLQLVEVDMHRYLAFAEGFLENTRDELNTMEREYLPLSGAYMAFIMGVRFLTDHLQGDVYFKTSFPGENLQRAEEQFALFDTFAAARDEMLALATRVLTSR